MQTKTENKMQNAIDMLAADLDVIKIVEDIERKPQTTKGHYGDYMSFLAPFRERSKTTCIIMGEALIKAGANAYGVQSALNLLILDDGVSAEKFQNYLRTEGK